MNLDREGIRAVPCPKCGAGIGERCSYSGKGAQKAMRLGKNHSERMHKAHTDLAELEVIEGEVPSRGAQGADLERRVADLEERLEVLQSWTAVLAQQDAFILCMLGGKKVPNITVEMCDRAINRILESAGTWAPFVNGVRPACDSGDAASDCAVRRAVLEFEEAVFRVLTAAEEAREERAIDPDFAMLDIAMHLPKDLAKHMTRASLKR